MISISGNPRRNTNESVNRTLTDCSQVTCAGCHRDGDIEPLTVAGLLPSDRDLLFETAYWRGCDHLKPGISAEVAVDWNTLWSQKLEGNSSPA